MSADAACLNEAATIAAVIAARGPSRRELREGGSNLVELDAEPPRGNPRGEDVHLRSAPQLLEYEANRPAHRRGRSLPDPGLGLRLGPGQRLHAAGLTVDPAARIPPMKELPRSAHLSAYFSSDPIRLPYADGCFDAVLSCGVLEHVQAASSPRLRGSRAPPCEHASADTDGPRGHCHGPGDLGCQPRARPPFAQPIRDEHRVDRCRAQRAIGDGLATKR
jgi:hypothetical protein